VLDSVITAHRAILYVDGVGAEVNDTRECSYENASTTRMKRKHIVNPIPSPLRSDELCEASYATATQNALSILAARSRPRYAAKGALNAGTFHYQRNLPVLQAFCI
jgi:hypothetical protein